MNDFMKGIIIVLLAVLIGLLLGIIYIITNFENSEEKKCIKGNYSTSITPFFNGKTVTMIPISNFICDEYEKI